MTMGTTRGGRGTSWTIATLLALVLAMSIGAASGAGAQQDPTSCGHFETQADAQAALDAGTLPHPEYLDYDGDGVACEDAFPDEGGPVAVDPTSCGHFETQADAQAALDAGNLPHPEYLDADGDGIACEDAFDVAETESEATTTSGARVIALPSTGTGAAAWNAAAAADLGGIATAGALALHVVALA